MRRIGHRIAHLLGWNRGTPEVLYLNDLPVARFRCSTCGESSRLRRLPRHVAPASFRGRRP